MIQIDVTHCWAELELGSHFRRSLRWHLREWLFAEIEERGFLADDTADFNRDPIEDQVDTMEADIIDGLKAAFRNRAKQEIADYSPATLATWLRHVLPGELEMRKQAFLADQACGLEFLMVIANDSNAEIEMEVE